MEGIKILGVLAAIIACCACSRACAAQVHPPGVLHPQIQKSKDALISDYASVCIFFLHLLLFVFLSYNQSLNLISSPPPPPPRPCITCPHIGGQHHPTFTILGKTLCRACRRRRGMDAKGQTQHL